MFPGKIIITGMLVFAVMTGCAKKNTDQNKEFSSTPATTPAASQDIFDEFYKEDTAAGSKIQETAAKSEPVRQTSASAVSFSENGRYAVQVSTVASRSLAESIVAKLDAKGYPSYVAEVQNPTPDLPGTYYRVRIGGFTMLSAAKSFGENSLVPDGYDFWVDYRSNDNVGIDGRGMGSGSDTYYSTETEATTDYSSMAPQPAASSDIYSPEPSPEPAAAPEPPPPPPAAEPAPAPAAATTDDAGTDGGSTQESEWGNDEW